jgi:hypothetical protein
LNTSSAAGDTNAAVIAPFTAKHQLLVYTIGDEAYRDAQKASYGGEGWLYADYKIGTNALGPVDATRAGAPLTGTYNTYPNSVTGVSGSKDFGTALHPTASAFIRVNGGTYDGSRMWEDQSYSGTNRLFLMDPSSSVWRAHIIAKLQAFLSAYGYDGVFLDNIDLNLYRYRASGQARHEGGQTGAWASGGSGIVGYSVTAGSRIGDAAYYSANWRAAMGNYVQAIRAALPSSAFLFGNATNGEFSSSCADEYDVVTVGGVNGVPVGAGLDGVMLEAWVNFPTDWMASGYGTADQWLGQILQAERLVDQGKHVMCVSQADAAMSSMATTSPDAAKHLYGLANYLLIASWDTVTRSGKAIPLSSFRHSSYGFASPLSDYFKVREITQEADVAALGYPTAARVQTGANTWTRQFSGGVVAVNNLTHVGTITLS